MRAASKWDKRQAEHPGAVASRDRYRAKQADMRKSSLARTSLVRNRAIGEPLREANPIKCQVCCDQPWRREGICAGCGQPYQEEQIR